MDLVSLKQRFGIIGNNEAMNRALEIAVRVAATDLSVLITGESGVGKEFFPQIIHSNSARKHGNYIAVNCGAIPEGTIDSELFGHEKGAFTGASDSRKGYFEVADGGTIFLDEVAELPQTTQVRLLRVLQTGEFIRVGSSKTIKTNVRVVAATNINLREAIDNGRFRDDLYYRLNTVPIIVPPLRERREDIYLLFRKFASDIAIQYRMPSISLDEGARVMLESYSWPGNIRQLKNVAEQISAVEESRSISGEIMQRYLPNYTTSALPMVQGRLHTGDFGEERELLYKVLFDLRSDMSELKRLVGDLVAERGSVDRSTDRTAERLVDHPLEHPTLLPRNLPAVTTNAATSPAYTVFADTEEIIEEPKREPLTKAQAQKESIIKALQRNKGKRRDAARELFISERTLYRKIKDLEIDEDKYAFDAPF